MVTAFVFITTKTGKEREVLGKIAQCARNSVKELHTVYGDYDIIAKIETENLDKLNELIINCVRGVPEIASTNTLIEL